MITIYKCEKCHKEFDNFDDCLKHEVHFHKRPIWVETVSYSHIDRIDVRNEARPYPASVDIKMDDGAIVRYALDCVVKQAEEVPAENESAAETVA